MGGPSSYKLQEMRERGELDETPRRRNRQQPGQPPTLAQMAAQVHWWWLVCNHCRHEVAFDLLPLIARWGPDESSDRLRASAKCSKCGHRGARTIMPSWAGADVGWPKFPG